MIDVIIPAHNAKGTIEATLASIVSQVILDKLHITIVNDKSDYSFNYLVEQYKDICNIQEFILEENRGPGFARQYAIERTNQPFIIFIDADDVFMNVFSLANLLEAISKNEKSIMTYGSFLDEVESGRYVEGVSVLFTFHGAIYRRKFIEENNIKFLPSRANEDVGYNYQVLLRSDVSGKYSIDGINTFTYLRKYNKNSITAKNPIKFQFLDGILGSVENRLFAFLKEDKENSLIIERGSASAVDFYYHYIEMLEIAPEYEKEVLKSLKHFYFSFGKYCIDNYDKDKLEDGIKSKKEAFLQDGAIFKEDFSFDDFIEKLES